VGTARNAEEMKKGAGVPFHSQTDAAVCEGDGSPPRRGEEEEEEAGGRGRGSGRQSAD